jgi:hypothetical protein
MRFLSRVFHSHQPWTICRQENIAYKIGGKAQAVCCLDSQDYEDRLWMKDILIKNLLAFILVFFCLCPWSQGISFSCCYLEIVL